jgi:triosephosphate isomerase
VIVAANWKMHAPDPGAWLETFGRARGAAADGRTVILFPPFPLLPAAGAAIGRAVGVELGAQNCHWEVEGAFTGEVSPAMVRAAGCRWVLVGHSERRHLFGETDETCRKKLRAALAHGLRPVLCVGETLAEREAGRARAVVLSQLSRAADGLDRDGYRRLVVAYEPVWAIGTGRTAAPADAQEMHAAVRDALAGIATGELAAGIPILYGGSVKPDNARELLARPDVDGALVGGASLDPAGFAAIAGVS